MSNIQKAFLPLLFFSLLSTQAIASPQISRADSITKRAEYLFRFEKYKEGISAYETLYQEGYFTEKSLYRLAFMHEQEGNFASSIYYLRKIQWEYGGPNIESKIAQLLRQYRQGQQPLGNMWTSTQRFIYHHQGNISIGSPHPGDLLLPKPRLRLRNHQPPPRPRHHGRHQRRTRHLDQDSDHPL